MAGIRVNFSSEEASTKALDLLPAGEYHVKLTDIEEQECGPDSKNPGKPYWRLVFTVQDGKHEGRKIGTNCMLFSGALYTFSQLMQASGHNVTEGDFEVPDPDDLVSKDYLVRVKVKPAKNGYDEGRDIRWIKAWNPAAKTGKSSLLPS